MRRALLLAVLLLLAVPGVAGAATRTVRLPLPASADLAVYQLAVTPPPDGRGLRVGVAAKDRLDPAITVVGAAQAEARGRRMSVDAVIVRRGNDAAGGSLPLTLTAPGRTRVTVLGTEVATDVLNNPFGAALAPFCARGGLAAPAPSFRLLAGQGFGFSSGQMVRASFDLACLDAFGQEVFTTQVRESQPAGDPSAGAVTDARWRTIGGDPDDVLLIFRVSQTPVFFIRATLPDGRRFIAADADGRAPANIPCNLVDDDTGSASEVTCGRRQCTQDPDLLKRPDASAGAAQVCGGQITAGTEYRGRMTVNPPPTPAMGGTMIVEQFVANDQPAIRTEVPIRGP